MSNDATVATKRRCGADAILDMASALVAPRSVPHSDECVRLQLIENGPAHT